MVTTLVLALAEAKARARARAWDPTKVGLASAKALMAAWAAKTKDAARAPMANRDLRTVAKDMARALVRVGLPTQVSSL